MIPESLVGLVLFVALLVPGFVYLERRERHHPGVDYSALRETSLVVVTSTASLAFVMLAFGAMRLIESPSLPNVLVPDVGAYVQKGELYVRAHYVEAALWFLIVVGLASALAAIVSVPPRWTIAVSSGRLRSWLERRRGPGAITQESGWSVALDLHPGKRKMVEVVLTDGSAVFGHLFSRSTQVDETPDRDMVLAAPIEVRSSGAEEWIALEKTGTLVLSASQVRYFSVTYLDSLPEDTTSDGHNTS